VTGSLEPGRDEPGPAGPLFWISAAAGWAVIAVGLRGIFTNSLDTRPANLARFVVAGALLHDLFVAPVVIVLAVALARTVPRQARAAVQGALAVSGMLALFSYPLVRAYGLSAHNPTSLPHNYAANLLIVLGVVWAVAAAVAIRRIRAAPPAPAPLLDLAGGEAPLDELDLLVPAQQGGVDGSGDTDDQDRGEHRVP
jgi:hypothetical protein